MGFIGDVFGGIKDAFTGGIGGTIMDFGSKLLGNTITRDNANAAYDQSKEASALAYQRQKELFKNRYQWTTQDMVKAGINPIMAASGGFNVGSGQSVSPATAFMANQSNLSASSTAKDFSQAEKNKEETFLVKEKADKVHHEINKLLREMPKIDAETLKIKADMLRIFSQTSIFDVTAEMAERVNKWIERLDEKADEVYDGSGAKKSLKELVGRAKLYLNYYWQLFKEDYGYE